MTKGSSWDDKGGVVPTFACKKDLPAGKVLFGRRSYLFAVRAQARRKPLPKISLELVTIMKALGSWAFR